jgi:PPOX class probable F420-dependent enzyme
VVHQEVHVTTEQPSQGEAAQRGTSRNATPLPDGLLELLERPSPCFIATIMRDGSPQLTQVWVDAGDDGHIIVNTINGSQKSKNVARDARVALNICDPDATRRYYGVRGRVVVTTTEGAREHVDRVSQRYLGRPYPGFPGVSGERLMIIIAVDSVTPPLLG